MKSLLIEIVIFALMIKGSVDILNRLLDIPNPIISVIVIGFLSAGLIDWLKMITIEKENIKRTSLL